jgi:PAS domain S-box-containing protein
MRGNLGTLDSKANFCISRTMTQVSASKKDGIWIIDAKGHTVFSNERMAEILGTTVEKLRGEDSFSYLFPEDAPEAQRLFAAKQAGSSARFHFRLRRKDGSSVWVDVQGTPMHNAAGEFIGIVGTFTVSNAQDA